MTDPTDEPKNPSVNADHNSNAVGIISAGGDISGNIHIGNVYQTPEEDLPLSSDEIENGLTRFAQFLPERAPVLQDSFSSIAKKLRATLGADQNSLSPALKSQREDGVDRMKLMCMEVTDISFRAICLGQNPPPYDSRPPFLGLFAFRPEDREFFFGRDALVQKLVTRIKAHPFLAVLGASGSGKSSLVMAGLVPALEAQMSYLTPSSAPLSQLLTAKESASAKTVFVIDQFEELFTHPHDAAERADFIHALLDLTKTNRVVITMRADFWGEVAIYADLRQAMQEHQELIAPMTVDELHSAMEKQAAVVGLRFDPTLSESILAEVKGEPGAMPLLQHALWELWNRRHGLWIKAEEYQAFGGVKQAITSTAEEVYASCSDFERARVRDIFLRLTRLDPEGGGEGRDTRRRVPIEELIPVNSDSSVTINLLNKLADARLIVKTEADVEVAHEALIRHWALLKEWLNKDRQNNLLYQEVRLTAHRWSDEGHDESLLNHRGPRLELALTMSKKPLYRLNLVEQMYLDSCVGLREREKAAATSRRRYTIAGVSTALVAIMAILVGWGWTSSQNAVELGKQRDMALARQLAAQAQSLFAGRSSQQMMAVLLAAESLKISEVMQAPPSLEAMNILQSENLALLVSETPIQVDGMNLTFSHDGQYFLAVGCTKTLKHNCVGQSYIVVGDASTGTEITRMYHDHGMSAVTSIHAAVFSLDGLLVVSCAEDEPFVTLWEAQTGNILQKINYNAKGYVSSLAFSPDAKQVAIATTTGVVLLWDIQTQTEVMRFKGAGTTSSHIIFSPDGKYIASTVPIVDNVFFGDIFILDAATGNLVSSITHAPLVSDFTFSNDGRYLFSVGPDGIARVWDIATSQEIYRVQHDGPVNQVEVSPNGDYAVSQIGTTTLLVWQTLTGVPLTQIQQDSVIRGFSFSPDGRYVIASTSDGVIRTWDIFRNKIETALRPYQSRIVSIRFSPDGQNLVAWTIDPSFIQFNIHSGAEVNYISLPDAEYPMGFSPGNAYYVERYDDHSVKVRETLTNNEVGQITQDAVIQNIGLSADGKLLALADPEGTINIWHVPGQKLVQTIHRQTKLYRIQFSPNGTLLAVLDMDGLITIWDVNTWEVATKLAHGEENILAMDFSPDNKWVVTGGRDNTARLWDARTGKQISVLSLGGYVTAVAFSPDGKYIATSCTITCLQPATYIWDLVTLKKIAQIQHKRDVYSLAFSPDSKYILSTDDNGFVDLSLYRAKDLIAEVCMYLTRNLTGAEWSQYIGDALPYQAICPNLPIEAEATPVP